MPSNRLTGFSSAFDELLETQPARAGRAVGRRLWRASPLANAANAFALLRRTLRCAAKRGARRIDTSACGDARPSLPRGARARRKARRGLALRRPGSDQRGRRAGGAMPGERARTRREPHLAWVRPDTRSRTRRRIGTVGHGGKRALHPGSGRRRQCGDARSDPGGAGSRAPGNRVGTGRLRAAALMQCDST